jgi:hypothetical protein
VAIKINLTRHGNFDQLWKMRALFDKLLNSYAYYYSLTKHLALDNFVLFKGIVIFKQYIPKKHRRFGIKLCRLCSSKGYTYNMTVYLGEDRKRDFFHDIYTCKCCETCSKDWTYGIRVVHEHFFFYFQCYLTMYILRQ